MEGSQIQQGTMGSTQQGTFSPGNQKALSEFIALLKDKIPELQLETGDKSEIEADIATIEAQIASNRPKSGIIKESIGSIRRVLEGAAGTFAATELLKYLPALEQFFSQLPQ